MTQVDVGAEDGLEPHPSFDYGYTSGAPVGSTAFMPGNAAPDGYLKLNGALLDRVTYSALWAYAQASGNIAASDGAWTAGKFSPGDGSTTFRIPDARGEFIRGWDDARGVDSSRAIGTSQSDDTKSHGHTASSAATSHNHSINGYVSTGGSTSGLVRTATGSSPASLPVTTDTTHTHAITVDATGGTETRPRNIAWLACIKYQ